MKTKDKNEVSMKFSVVIDSEFKDLALEYLQNRRQEFSHLQELIKEKNFEKISTLAHKVKGNAGTYGYPELTILGKLLEEAAQNENLKECLQLIGKIEDYIINVETTFI